MRRWWVLVVAVLGLVAAGCVPPPAPSGRYVDLVFDEVTSATEVYATRPDLLTGDPVTLRLDRYEPVGDDLDARPAIVWIHGGGFKGGDRSAFADVATEWARRGYVTASISYRLDPGNRCQDVQQGRITDPVELAAETERCRTAILAAYEDALEAIRWIRSNADALGVDPTRVAVGGGSAGAVTAINVAQLANGTGGPAPADVEVGAALAMSGCQYDLSQVDADDAPVSILASGFDVPTPFTCVQATVDAVEAAGGTVELLAYPLSSAHARTLYNQNKAAVDAAWTAFLVEHLDLG